MKQSFKKKLLPIIGISLAGVTAVAAVSTMAYFMVNKDVNQEVYPDGGEMKKSIFLDCDSLWNVGLNELFYAYVWKQGSNPFVKEYLTPTKGVSLDMTIAETNVSSESVTRNVYVFQFDALKYDRIIFTRMNPGSIGLNSESQPNCSIGDSSWWDERNRDSGGADYLWGRTKGDITVTYTPGTGLTHNYYRVDEYFTNSKLCKYSYGTINENSAVTIAGYVNS